MSAPVVSLHNATLATAIHGTFHRLPQETKWIIFYKNENDLEHRRRNRGGGGGGGGGGRGGLGPPNYEHYVYKVC